MAERLFDQLFGNKNKQVYGKKRDVFGEIDVNKPNRKKKIFHESSSSSGSDMSLDRTVIDKSEKGKKKSQPAKKQPRFMSSVINDGLSKITEPRKRRLRKIKPKENLVEKVADAFEEAKEKDKALQILDQLDKYELMTTPFDPLREQSNKYKPDSTTAEIEKAIKPFLTTYEYSQSSSKATIGSLDHTVQNQVPQQDNFIHDQQYNEPPANQFEMDGQYQMEGGQSDEQQSNAEKFSHDFHTALGESRINESDSPEVSGDSNKSCENTNDSLEIHHSPLVKSILPDLTKKSHTSKFIEKITTAGLGDERIASTPTNTNKSRLILLEKNNLSPIEGFRSPESPESVKQPSKIKSKIPIVQNKSCLKSSMNQSSLTSNKPPKKVSISDTVNVSTIESINKGKPITRTITRTIKRKVDQQSVKTSISGNSEGQHFCGTNIRAERDDSIEQRSLIEDEAPRGQVVESSKYYSITHKSLSESDQPVLEDQDDNTIVNSKSKNSKSSTSKKKSISSSSKSKSSDQKEDSEYETFSNIAQLTVDFVPPSKSTPLKNISYQSLAQRNFVNSKYYVDLSKMDMSIQKYIQKKKTNTKLWISKDSIINSKLEKKSPKEVNKYYRQSIFKVNERKDRTIVPNECSQRGNTDKSISVLRNQDDLTNLSCAFNELSVAKPDDNQLKVLTAKEKVFQLCQQNQIIQFEDLFDKAFLKKCKKIGEGSYGEVFSSKDKQRQDVIIKIIAMDMQMKEQEMFGQILPELMINMTFNLLNNGISNSTPNYIHLKKMNCVRGKFLEELKEKWYEYYQEHGSENEWPDTYDHDQLYMVVQLANGGEDLEKYKLRSAKEALSVFLQLCLSLAAAEQEYEFEHRDLHWGNVLVDKTNKKTLEYKVNHVNYSIANNQMFISIIDFSLSRMKKDGFIIYDDLDKYDDLFQGQGDYQFEIYRKMQKQTKNQWANFNPKTNIFWLDYILDKLINEKTYNKRFNSKVETTLHTEAFNQLKDLHQEINQYHSAFHFVSSDFFRNLKFVKVQQEK